MYTVHLPHLWSCKKFYRTDDGKYTGIFDVDNQVVADLRHDVTQCLWQNNIDHGLYMCHADRLGSFCLTRVNGKDTAADSLCHVCTCVDGYDEDRGKPHGHIDIEQVCTTEVDKHCLCHHRSSTEELHIAGKDKFHDFDQYLLGCGIVFVYRDRLHDTYEKTDDASKSVPTSASHMLTPAPFAKEGPYC